MASAIPTIKEKMCPWNVEIVTPSDALIAKFDEFDQTKSTAPLGKTLIAAKRSPWQGFLFAARCSLQQFWKPLP